MQVVVRVEVEPEAIEPLVALPLLTERHTPLRLALVAQV